MDVGRIRYVIDVLGGLSASISRGAKAMLASTQAARVTLGGSVLFSPIRPDGNDGGVGGLASPDAMLVIGVRDVGFTPSVHLAG